MAIHREFVPREGMRLQFRAEAFNLTNTPPFGAPGGSFGSATFGVISRGPGTQCSARSEVAVLI